MRTFLLTFLMLCIRMHGWSQCDTLRSLWQFRSTDESSWMPASVPGTVHTDLMLNRQIPDPFYRDNESKVQWVAEQDWEYKTTFSPRKNTRQYKQVWLQFDGLDTYADVYLNGREILHANNMFRTWRIEVSRSLKAGDNEVRIVFHSAVRVSDSLAALSRIKRPCENNRHYTRKAQYHFGWDWAPRLVTCGIWRPVCLVYGEPPKPSTACYKPVKLVREKDAYGTSFYFTVDGKPIMMKGANWIPADVFLPRLSKSRYRSLLLAAKEANFNMLRVWGGGIYEDDAFYDLCDSLGIYVWQDFMFAGAMYPGDAQSLANIRQEAIDNILRLRRHKCIAVWCGNNEIDEAWKNWGWQQQFAISATDSMQLWNEYNAIFHELLPSLVKQYDSGRAYITTSPLNGWGRKESMTQGDAHYWGMWWGMDSIAVMKRKIPRFMSEYGMQAMPSMESIEKFSLPEDRDTSSAVFRTHQKHPTGYKTLQTYLDMEQIRVTDFASFVEGTQEVQARALGTAIDAQLHSNGRCMGTLFWQFNDCWPVCSWSIVDYYGARKKAFETVKSLYKENQ